MLLVLAFFGTTLLVMALVLVITRPSASDKAVRERIVHSYFTRQRENEERLAQEKMVLLKAVHLSHYDWLDRLLVRVSLAHTVQGVMEQTDLHWDVGDLLLSSVAVFVLAGGTVFLWGKDLGASAVAGAVAACVPYRVVLLFRSRRMAAFDSALPDAIEMMSRSLQAGQSVGAALDMVATQASGPLRSEFAEVAKRQNLGLPFREALMQMTTRVASADLHFLVTAILVQKETGGNLIEILDHTAEVIRDRIRIRGEVRTYTAQGRMTGWVLALLPLVLMLLMNLVDPEYAHILLDNPTGRKLLYVSMGLLLVGALVIRKIVRIDV